MPITIGRPKTIKLIEDMTNMKDFIGIISQKSTNIEDPDLSDCFNIGSIARIIKLTRTGKVGFNIVVEGLKRFEIIKITQSKPFMIAEIRVLENKNMNDIEIDALHLNLKSMAKEVINLLPEIPLMAKQLIDSISFPGHLADMIGANLDATLYENNRY